MSKSKQGLTLAMGIYDTPESQRQPLFEMNLYRNHVAVFGGFMSGKTTFIKTMLVRLHENRSKLPPENIYIIDFSQGLTDYVKLPDVCACLDNSNEEDVKRVFKLLEARMKANTDALKGKHYYALAQEAANPADCPPHYTLVIENINAFLTDERYSTYQDRLMVLCRDGLSKGVSVVFTANTLSGLGRLLPFFGQKVAFSMDAADYAGIFSGKVAETIRTGGRGIINIEVENGARDSSGNFEFQCFWPFHTHDEKKALEAMCSNEIPNPNKLQVFERELKADMIRDFLEEACIDDDPDKIIVGLDYYEHKPIILDLGRIRSVAIYGKHGFGKSNLLRRILYEIERKWDAKYFFLDDGKKELEQERDGFRSASCEFTKTLPGFHTFCNWAFGNTGTDASLPAQKDPCSLKQLFSSAQKLQNPEAHAEATEKAPAPVGEAEGTQETQTRPFAEDDSKTETKKPNIKVLIIQNRHFYLPSNGAFITDELAGRVADAKENNVLFIFSDTRRFSEFVYRNSFNDCIQQMYILDDIGSFLSERGRGTALGESYTEAEIKELKKEYAECSPGDGYCYDVDSEELIKARFIFEPKRTQDAPQ